MALNNPDFNSGDIAWSHLECFVNGTRVSKLRGIKYKASSEFEHLYGAGNEPIGNQPGNSSYSGSLKVLAGELQKMNAAAAAAGASDVRGIPFTIVVNYKATLTTPRRTVTLSGVNITEFEEGMEQGAKMSEIDLPFIFLAMTTTP